MVVANFLMSLRPRPINQTLPCWGDPTVLDLEKLSDEDRALFPATLPVLGASVLEPHASWVQVLEDGWACFAS